MSLPVLSREQPSRRRRIEMALEALPPAAGLINLNGDGSYISWGVIQISWANAIVILLMVLVFVLALVLPFPGHGSRDEGSR
jgi:hypothetical protein